MDSVKKVFSMPLLLDKIVKFTIYNTEDGDIDKNIVASTRRMNKSWLQSTSKVLRQLGTPAVHIKIGCPTESATLNTKEFKNKGNILDECVSVFSKASRSNDSFLPIHLSIDQLYFVQENCENLTNFLENCGDIISYLIVSFPLDGGSMNLNCSRFQFPMLQVLKFMFEMYSEPAAFKSKAPVFGSNTNGLTLLQEILRNSNKLEKLYFQYDDKTAEIISTLSLPLSLTMLQFESSISSNELALLTRNRMPNFKVLRMNIQTVSEDNLVNRILERFQHQLTTLHMSYIVDENEPSISIKFPLMKKLKSLSLFNQGFDLIPESRHNLSKQLPNLEDLDFFQIPQSLFLDWFQGSQFEKVKDLNIWMIMSRTDFRTWSPNVSSVETIKNSFPNIQKLTLVFHLDDTISLKYLFRSFRHLKELDLKFFINDWDELARYKMVSLFLGVALEQAAVIVDGTDENVNVQSDNTDSVMNMKELHYLTLRVPEIESLERPEDPFCLDMISKYALERMPKLRKVELKNKQDNQSCKQFLLNIH